MAIERATLDQGAKLLALFKDVPREQVQAVLASGFLADVRDANFNEPIDRAALRRILGLKPLNPLLLEEIGTVVVQATDSPFVTDDRVLFKGVSVKISVLGIRFQKCFLGKTEDPMAETELRYAKLIWPSLDRSILAELGNKAETTLTQVFALIERQPNGEEGVLLTDGGTNIFYVRDIRGELRAVDLGWDGHGWFVDAGSVEDPHGWIEEDRVFSNNS